MNEDFYQRNRIERCEFVNTASPSPLLDCRSRDKLLRYTYHQFAQDSRKMRGTSLWSFVGMVTGHGSGYSTQICHELGWDPEMECGRGLRLPEPQEAKQP